jgi:hypothetical protein
MKAAPKPIVQIPVISKANEEAKLEIRNINVYYHDDVFRWPGGPVSTGRAGTATK